MKFIPTRRASEGEPGAIRRDEEPSLALRVSIALCALALTHAFLCYADAAEPRRPNILFAIADDWGWPHAGAYGDPVVKTPTFDRLAREGALFQNAFVSSPSCTPSRGAILTGQWHWRLEEGANLWSTLPVKFPVYPELLAKAGYHIGHMRKAWGPGQLAPGGRNQDPAGRRYASFEEFMKKLPEGRPFCFWLGSSDPHRPYQLGSGAARGMDLDAIRLPACFPDDASVRGDVADYYVEVERFDSDVGRAVALLQERGELDHTIVVMTGDHGMPFPRSKSNLYDTGTHVPLAIRWGEQVQGGRAIKDIVSLVDLAPTFLEAAGLGPPEEMTGRSLMKILTAEGSGQIDPKRASILTGKERHVPSQEIGDTGGYPSRAIRTHDHLYIRNFRPDRWPNGIADAQRSHMGWAFSDCDDGPTKTYLVSHRSDPEVAPFFELAFGKRPAEELYDLEQDPDQLTNVAGKPEYADVQKRLAAQLAAELKATHDPRMIGGGERFDSYLYYGEPRRPTRQ